MTETARRTHDPHQLNQVAKILAEAFGDDGFLPLSKRYGVAWRILDTLTSAQEPPIRTDFMPDSTETVAALTARPLTIEDTDAIRRTRDYLGVHLRVYGPDEPIATIDESAEPGGHLWRLTPADLGRTLVPTAPHTTYEGMQALRHHAPLTDEPARTEQ